MYIYRIQIQILATRISVLGVLGDVDIGIELVFPTHLHVHVFVMIEIR